MDTQELKSRYQQLQARIVSAKAAQAAWVANARHMLGLYDAGHIGELPEIVQDQLAEDFRVLVSITELEGEQAALEREVSSYAVVQELRRLYFLPDPRPEKRSN